MSGVKLTQNNIVLTERDPKLVMQQTSRELEAALFEVEEERKMDNAHTLSFLVLPLLLGGLAPLLLPASAQYPLAVVAILLAVSMASSRGRLASVIRFVAATFAGASIALALVGIVATALLQGGR